MYEFGKLHSYMKYMSKISRKILYIIFFKYSEYSGFQGKINYLIHSMQLKTEK